jgi:hypothetical protein
MSRILDVLARLSDAQLNTICRVMGLSEEEIEATIFKPRPEPKTHIEEELRKWDDPEWAARQARVGFDKERLLAIAAKRDAGTVPCWCKLPHGEVVPHINPEEATK